MRGLHFCLLPIALVACAPVRDDVAEAPRHESAASARSERDARFRTAMRVRELDLQHISALLRAGRLDDATTNAFWLARPHSEEVLAQWPAEATRLRAAAQQLTNARDLVQALRAEAQIAGACGDCHVAAHATAAFERDVQTPRDDGTPASRLRRHAWAAARLFDGTVGGSDRQWRAGLEVFETDIAGYRVHEIATRALATNEDRRSVHARLLEACMTCHPSVLRH